MMSLVTGTNSFEIKRHGQHLSLKFNKRAELFIRVHNETLPVTMRVNNPDRSPVGIKSLRHSPNSNQLC
jgi:hypothetical protein